MTLDEAISELRRRNEPVPKPAPLPHSADVDRIERELEVKLHSDLRHYLLQASDVVCGTKEPVTITLPQSHTFLPDVARSAWNAHGMPRDLLPICEDNGNYYCMDSSGRIVFWSHDGTTDEMWPNLATWIMEVWIGEE